MSIETVTVRDGTGERKVQIDTRQQVYDPRRKTVRPIVRSSRDELNELRAMVVKLAARVSELERRLSA